VNLRRHREFTKQLNASLDVAAGAVYHELMLIFGFQHGFECRWCHRPVVSTSDPATFECPCGHIRWVVYQVEQLVKYAPLRFRREMRAFQEAA